MDSYNLSSPVGVQATVSPGGEDQDYWQQLHGGCRAHSRGGDKTRGITTFPDSHTFGKIFYNYLHFRFPVSSTLL